MINWINELVGKDGVRIGNDNVALSVDNSVSASNSTMDPMYNPEDGTQLKNAVAQQRQQGYREYPYSLIPLPAKSYGEISVGTDYMADEKSYKEKMVDKVEKAKERFSRNQFGKTPKKHGNPDSYRNKMIDKVEKAKERIKEASKHKMEEYVEDIVNKRISKDVLSKSNVSGDIRKNGIPSVDIIGEENPVLIRKVKNLIDIIEKNQATGEEKGIILNYLISNIGTSDIPQEYKQEMFKNFR